MTAHDSKLATLCRIANRAHWLPALAVAVVLVAAAWCRADVLLDDSWADGSRAESKRPAEAAVMVGRPADVAVSARSLSTKMGESSQKIWVYFTDGEPVTLKDGETLTASVSFILRGKLEPTTSRNFRFGVFHDATDPRVETDVNSDAGGDAAPWKDSQGYAVQILLTGDANTYTKPLDLGKRVNEESQSLLGTSGDYAKMSGGTPAPIESDKEYTATLAIKRVSAKHNDITTSLSQGDQQLATWSLSDNGSSLGAAAPCDKFDQLFIRISDGATTAERIDFTNFKVEVTGAAP